MLGLKEARKRSKIPIRKVASRAGVSLSTVQRWESGGGLPGPDDLVALAAIYGTTIAELAGETIAVLGTPVDATFVEHVLYTAGRIAELANQIAWAAAQQQRVTQDLGEQAKRQLPVGPPISPERVAEGEAALAAMRAEKTKASSPAKKRVG